MKSSRNMIHAKTVRTVTVKPLGSFLLTFQANTRAPAITIQMRIVVKSCNRKAPLFEAGAKLLSLTINAKSASRRMANEEQTAMHVVSLTKPPR